MPSHLTARVYTLHGLAGEGVPESNIPKKTVESYPGNWHTFNNTSLQRLRKKVLLFFSPIGSAAAAGQQPVVVGGPGDGLHRGHVVAVGLHKDGKLHKVTQNYTKFHKVTKFQCKVDLHGRGLSAPRPGPHEQLVVVTPAGEVLEKYFVVQLKIFKCLQL